MYNKSNTAKHLDFKTVVLHTADIHQWLYSKAKFQSLVPSIQPPTPSKSKTSTLQSFFGFFVPTATTHCVVQAQASCPLVSLHLCWGSSCHHSPHCTHCLKGRSFPTHPMCLLVHKHRVAAAHTPVIHSCLPHSSSSLQVPVTHLRYPE